MELGTDSRLTGPWDSQRDETENEELELEMARLPSSIFEEDVRPGYIDHPY
jgi:hypothetical protein